MIGKKYSPLENTPSLIIVQDMANAILVMKEAANWLLTSGKNPNKWWHPGNLNEAAGFIGLTVLDEGYRKTVFYQKELA